MNLEDYGIISVAGKKFSSTRKLYLKRDGYMTRIALVYLVCLGKFSVAPSKN